MKAKQKLNWLISAGLLLLWQGFAAAVEVDMQPLERLVLVSDGLGAGAVSVSVEPGGHGDARAIVPGEKLRYVFRQLQGFSPAGSGQADYGIEVSLYENQSILLSSEPWALKRDKDARPAKGLPLLRPGGDLVLTVPTAGLNLKAGSAYRLKLRLVERQTQASYTLEHRFDVLVSLARQARPAPQRSDSLGIALMQQGLVAGALRLEDESSGSELQAPRIGVGKSLKLHFDQVEGLTPVEGKIYPGYEVIFINAMGQTLMYFDDLSRLSEEGTAAKGKDDLSSAVKFSDPGRYFWSVRIFDKHSGRQLASKTWVEIVPEAPNLFDNY